MLPLLARLFPGPIYHGRWDDIPDYAAFCPFSGLPRLEGTRADKVPAPIPYISPDPARARAMQAWLDQHAPPNHRRIGIAWAGRPTHNNDRNRTVPLSTFFPLASVPGHVFVSLQKGPAKSQLAGWPGKLALLDADPLLQTFDDTTALVASLDMVVCVDTSVGHVAGALGKPGWVLVPFAPDWRWMIGRMDSPWYPSLRLYRQPRPKQWAEVVEHVLEDFAALPPAGAAAQPG
jgi:hypothetical protein